MPDARLELVKQIRELIQQAVSSGGIVSDSAKDDLAGAISLLDELERKLRRGLGAVSGRRSKP